MSKEPPFLGGFFVGEFKSIEKPVERAAGELNLNGLFNGPGMVDVHSLRLP